MSTVEQPDCTVFMADGSDCWSTARAKPDSNRMYRWKNGPTNVLIGDATTHNLNCKTDLTTSQFLVA